MKLYEVVRTFYVMVNEAETINSEWWESLPFEQEDDRTCGQIAIYQHK